MPEHSRLAVTLTYLLSNAFKDTDCLVFESSLRIQIAQLNSVLYPDGSVSCEPLRCDPLHPSLVRNPSLILEIASKSTSEYVRASNFLKYQMIPSLKTYVLVEQKEPRVYVGHKNPQGEWGFTDYFGMEADVELAPLGVSIPLAQIYKRIAF